MRGTGVPWVVDVLASVAKYFPLGIYQTAAPLYTPDPLDVEVRMSKVFLSEHFKQSVENHRNRVALVDERGQSWTYEALGDEVERLAGRFRQLPGDTVGILLLKNINKVTVNHFGLNF